MEITRMATALLLVAAMFVLAACRLGPVGSMPMAPGDAAMTEPAPPPAPEPGKLTVVDVRARPAPLAGGNGAAYMTVLNGLDAPVRLVSAASAAAEFVETHETVEEQGVMKMIMLPDGYEIPAGAALELRPGGKHIMLIGLTQPLNPGDSFELTLSFDNGESMTVTVPVVEMTMTMPMGAMPGGDMDMSAPMEHGGAMATPTP
jgi:copper(I)-binding protein